MRSTLRVLLACGVMVGLVACGGGGGTPATTISGAAVKGPVDKATVTIKNANTGAVLGTTTTKADGTYNLDVTYAGDVVVEVTGGTYIDETTKVSTPLTTPLKTVLAANGGTVIGVVTPLTTLAYGAAFPAGTVGSAITTAAYKTKAAAVATQFKLTAADLDKIPDVATGTSDAYGKVLTSISKYMATNNKTLDNILNTTDWTGFNGLLNAAYSALYPNSGVTFSVTGFDAATGQATGVTNIAGTGYGGGIGVCQVREQGTINFPAIGSASAFTEPVDDTICFTGLNASATCDAAGASILTKNNHTSSLPGVTWTTSYTLSTTCSGAAGVINIHLL